MDNNLTCKLVVVVQLKLKKNNFFQVIYTYSDSEL